jgi:F-type H+-transporting ATPase subunit alpha
MAQLERGARLVELLKQGQYAPFPVEHQVVSIWAGTTGRLDIVPVKDIRRFEAEFLDFLGSKHQGIFDTIVKTGKLEDSTIADLEQAIEEFSKSFQTSDGEGLINEAAVDAMDKGDEGQESITRHKPAPKPQH